jgi:hypothetical protein
MPTSRLCTSACPRHDTPGSDRARRYRDPDRVGERERESQRQGQIQGRDPVQLNLVSDFFRFAWRAVRMQLAPDAERAVEHVLLGRHRLQHRQRDRI